MTFEEFKIEFESVKEAYYKHVIAVSMDIEYNLESEDWWVDFVEYTLGIKNLI